MSSAQAPVLPELLAPAGDWDCLRAAVVSGADAVYFGLPRFNARMRAENFREEELPEVVAYLHGHGVKAYVTLNVLVFTSELEDAIAELRLLNDTGVDAVIIQDVGIAELARRMFPALRVHASTQMTITSPEGVRFAETLGVRQVVLAREVSMNELAKFDTKIPLEVFVHGALCVAYSGQCLTSESLGQRSANRGECAQACRMPYEMIVDGVVHELGDKRYLLSPHDLAAVREIPELIRLGVKSFKIEGRLKSADYVTAVTAVYRRAIDDAVAGLIADPTAEEWYRLEMTFSRGLFSGWMHGVNHQKLVSAEFGKKRGALAGQVESTGRDYVDVRANIALHPGDGVVFENLANTNDEQGGRIYQVRGNRLSFEHGKLRTEKIRPGTRVWKTSDPALERELKKAGQVRPGDNDTRKCALALKFSGRTGEPVRIEVTGLDTQLSLASQGVLEPAKKFSLTTEILQDIFSRLNDTPYRLGTLDNALEESVFLPKSELNKLKHEMVQRLGAGTQNKRAASLMTLHEAMEEIVATGRREGNDPVHSPQLSVLCRSMEQIEASLAEAVGRIYADFEDIRRFKDAVSLVRSHGGSEIFPATPRIQKAGEQGFFKVIESACPDGVLIRNVGAIPHFKDSPLRKIGDFSLNVANPATAAVFRHLGLERLTISYDLTIAQILPLLAGSPPEWYELTIHQHMPMFHMEHCVFAAFLSEGTDHTNCGRPCETHRVHLRDRVGIEHPLRADVGCRNTLFNATPQTGATHFDQLMHAGLRHYRIELLEEDRREASRILKTYQGLLSGLSDGGQLWSELKARSQLGVTTGTMSHAGR